MNILNREMTSLLGIILIILTNLTSSSLSHSNLSRFLWKRLRRLQLDAAATTAPPPLHATSPPWLNPCTPLHRVTPHYTRDTNEIVEGSEVRSELKTYYRIIGATARYASRRANEAKERFIVDVLRSEALARDIRSLHVDGIPHRLVIEREVASANVSHIFRTLFRSLQSYYMYLEVADVDINMRADVLALSCEISRLMEVAGIDRGSAAPPPPRQVRHVATTANRHVRDYLILKDYKNYVTYLAELFTRMEYEEQPIEY